jgi:hypothetical protein
MEGRVMRVGIVGVGVIGQALARAIDRGEVAAQLTALHSRNLEKTRAFAHTLERVPEVVGDIAGVLARCDLVIEAATQTALSAIAPDILGAGKDLMVLSVGALLDHPEWPLAAHHSADSTCRQERLSGWMVSGACVGQVDSYHHPRNPQGLVGAPYVEAHVSTFTFTTETDFEMPGKPARASWQCQRIAVLARLALVLTTHASGRWRQAVHATYMTSRWQSLAVNGHIENVPTIHAPGSVLSLRYWYAQQISLRTADVIVVQQSRARRTLDTRQWSLLFALLAALLATLSPALRPWAQYIGFPTGGSVAQSFCARGGVFRRQRLRTWNAKAYRVRTCIGRFQMPY